MASRNDFFLPSVPGKRPQPRSLRPNIKAAERTPWTYNSEEDQPLPQVALKTSASVPSRTRRLGSEFDEGRPKPKSRLQHQGGRMPALSARQAQAARPGVTAATSGEEERPTAQIGKAEPRETLSPPTSLQSGGAGSARPSPNQQALQAQGIPGQMPPKPWAAAKGSPRTLAPQNGGKPQRPPLATPPRGVASPRQGEAATPTAVKTQPKARRGMTGGPIPVPAKSSPVQPKAAQRGQEQPGASKGPARNRSHPRAARSSQEVPRKYPGAASSSGETARRHPEAARSSQRGSQEAPRSSQDLHGSTVGECLSVV